MQLDLNLMERILLREMLEAYRAHGWPDQDERVLLDRLISTMKGKEDDTTQTL